MSESTKLTQLLDAQQGIIRTISKSTRLADILNDLCLELERISQPLETMASVLLLKGNRLYNGAAPHLPKTYCKAIEGVEIGPGVGSCGSAAYLNKPVIATDLSQHANWADFANLVNQHHLGACWSVPINDSNDNVIGTFAIYSAKPATPSEKDLEILHRFSGLASIAIEKFRAEAQRQQLTHSLTSQNNRLYAFTQVMPDLAFVLDRQGNYVDIFGADDEGLVETKETLLGHNISEFLPADIATMALNAIEKCLQQGELQQVEYELNVMKGPCLFEGRVTPIEMYDAVNPGKQHVLWVARDITQQKMTQQKIEKLAFYDPLTGLPNRRLFMDRLQQAIDHARREHQYGALMFLDLDNFKRINDSLGHSSGDELLLRVAKTLQGRIRDSDTLARFGGDEFTVIMQQLRSTSEDISSDAVHLAEELREGLRTPIELGQGEYKVDLSIGIAIFNGGSDAEDVLRHADAAMYNAKRSGKNCIHFHDPEAQKLIEMELELEREVIQAIKQEQIQVYFQPQVDLDHRLTGAEALVRWLHPEKGFVPPDRFIPLVERSGLINELQNRVLEKTCEMIKQCEKIGDIKNEFVIAINLSAKQFVDNQLEKDLCAATAKYDISPGQLKLEITESLLMENVEASVAQMHRLKDLGYSFSVDDFGTGYSSLAYLQKIPLDELKIDKMFVDNMAQSKSNLAIVDTIIALSQNLNFSLVAEGVETIEQFDMLNTRSVARFQGYLIGKPMPADDFINWAIAQARAHPYN